MFLGLDLNQFEQAGYLWCPCPDVMFKITELI